MRVGEGDKTFETFETFETFITNLHRHLNC